MEKNAEEKEKPRRITGVSLRRITRGDSPPHSCYITNITQYLDCQALIFQNPVLTEREAKWYCKTNDGARETQRSRKGTLKTE